MVEHFLECLKIIDGAVNGNRQKVTSYAKQLAAKLEEQGDPRSARSIRNVLAHSKLERLSASAGNSSKPPHKSEGLVGSARLPSDRESRVPLADESYREPSDVSAFFDGAVADRMEQFVRYIQAFDKLAAAGVGISPTVLFYGPPGCGKTLAAQRIAAELELPLITARTDGLISSYLGSTAKNIRALFEHASRRPCVLFLDEFDAVAKLRDDTQELGELKRVVVSLLQNIDALDQHTIVAAATNHEHLLDPAVWRRFAYKIQIKAPSEEVRYGLFKYFLGPKSAERDIRRYAELAIGLSGADIRDVSAEARRAAVLQQNGKLSPTLVIREIVRYRYPEVLSGEKDTATSVIETRKLNEQIFTYRVLGKLFDISTGQVSNILKSEGDCGRSSSANFESKNDQRGLQRA